MDNNKEIDMKTKNNKSVLIPREFGFAFSLFDWLKILLPLLAIAFLISTFFARITTVNGMSMADTLHDDDRLIVTNYYYNQPQSGDIVIISHGQELQEPLVKRVIATQGQKVDIDYDSNIVYVDNQPTEEPYRLEQDMIDFMFENNSLVVPEGMVFVMGDNRNNSLDSRSEEVGLIPLESIIGKAEVIFFPFDRIQYLYS